jgi:hypothetical protein
MYFRKFLIIGNIVHWALHVLPNFNFDSFTFECIVHTQSRSNICYSSKSYTRHFICLYVCLLLVSLIPLSLLSTKIRLFPIGFHKSAVFSALKLGCFVRILNTHLMCYFYINNGSKTALDNASVFWTQSGILIKVNTLNYVWKLKLVCVNVKFDFQNSMKHLCFVFDADCQTAGCISLFSFSRFTSTVLRKGVSFNLLEIRLPVPIYLRDCRDMVMKRANSLPLPATEFPVAQSISQLCIQQALKIYEHTKE